MEINDYTPIERCGLSVRAENCLVAAGARTLGDVRKMTDRELLHIRSFGRLSLREVKRLLQVTLEHSGGWVPVFHHPGICTVIGWTGTAAVVREVRSLGPLALDGLTHWMKVQAPR